MTLLEWRGNQGYSTQTGLEVHSYGEAVRTMCSARSAEEKHF